MCLMQVRRQHSPDQATGRRCTDWVRGETGHAGVGSDRELRVELHGVKVARDAGLLTYRELDDVFGLTELAGRQLCDPRTGTSTQHTMT